MKRSCFDGNDFLRQAPVLTLGGPTLDLTENWGSEDDDVVCQFISDFPTEEAVQALVNFTCVDYDSDSCKAELPETLPPMPTPAPQQATRQPVGAATPAPAILSSSATGYCLLITFATIGVFPFLMK